MPDRIAEIISTFRQQWTHRDPKQPFVEPNILLYGDENGPWSDENRARLLNGIYDCLRGSDNELTEVAQDVFKKIRSSSDPLAQWFHPSSRVSPCGPAPSFRELMVCNDRRKKSLFSFIEPVEAGPLSAADAARRFVQFVTYQNQVIAGIQDDELPEIRRAARLAVRQLSPQERDTFRTAVAQQLLGIKMPADRRLQIRSILAHGLDATRVPPEIHFSFVQNGKPIDPSRVMTGALQAVVTVDHAKGQHAQIYTNLVGFASAAIDSDHWTATVSIDTKQFFDGEQLFNVHVHKHPGMEGHGSGHHHHEGTEMPASYGGSDDASFDPDGFHYKAETIVVRNGRPGMGWKLPRLSASQLPGSSRDTEQFAILMAHDWAPPADASEHEDPGGQFIGHFNTSIFSSWADPRPNVPTPVTSIFHGYIQNVNLLRYRDPQGAHITRQAFFLISDADGRANIIETPVDLRAPLPREKPFVGALPDARILNIEPFSEVVLPTHKSKSPYVFQVEVDVPKNGLPDLGGTVHVRVMAGNTVLGSVPLTAPAPGKKLIVNIPVRQLHFPATYRPVTNFDMNFSDSRVAHDILIYGGLGELEEKEKYRHGLASTATALWVDFYYDESHQALPTTSHVHVNSVRTDAYDPNKTFSYESLNNGGL